MIDMSKALDRIKLRLLVKKLHNTDLPRAMVNIIGYMLSNTDVYVNYNDVAGDKWREVMAHARVELFQRYCLASI